tara:strand:- start:19 stop:336 length:318 start_codon:yes stop_codon:yes gene_type:complete
MKIGLLKELKDAGFMKGAVIDESRMFKVELLGIKNNELNYDILFKPTLSELIEACGNRLTIIENWGGRVDSGWSAYENEIDDLGIESKGKTPEEAVAKLWLELNK